MKYTNKHNFPDFVVQWLEHDEYDYDENTISATTLMKPARADESRLEENRSDLGQSQQSTDQDNYADVF